MTEIIILVSVLVMAVGVWFAVWTAANTRNKYYKEFMHRKSEREKLHLP
jgi:hypothetical protein